MGWDGIGDRVGLVWEMDPCSLHATTHTTTMATMTTTCVFLSRSLERETERQRERRGKSTKHEPRPIIGFVSLLVSVSSSSSSSASQPAALCQTKPT